MRRGWQKEAIQTAIFVVLYVLLGNARSVQENPFIDGATIAVNMIVPVIAGILFGRWPGFFVGLLGTTINSFTPAGSEFEMMAILPHAIMGFCAGFLKGKWPTPLIAFTLLIGHVLNLMIFTLFRKIELSLFSQSPIWLAVGYETIVGVISIIIIVEIYRLGFEH